MSSTSHRLLELLKSYKKFGLEGVKLFLNKDKKNKLLKVSLDSLRLPVYLRSCTSDLIVFQQVFNYEWYNINFNEPVKIIVDCGANIGLTSVFFKNKFPDASVIAIEPESTNFELLIKNTEGYSGIHCLKYGIWNKPAILEVVDPGLGNDGFMVKEVPSGNKNTIEAISIDEIIRNYQISKIDILKIDIEGSEKELFASNYEKWLPYVKVLVIELHDRMKEGCSKSFFKAIINYDYELVVYGESLICYFKQN